MIITFLEKLKINYNNKKMTTNTIMFIYYIAFIFNTITTIVIYPYSTSL